MTAKQRLTAAMLFRAKDPLDEYRVAIGGLATYIVEAFVALAAAGDDVPIHAEGFGDEDELEPLGPPTRAGSLSRMVTALVEVDR